MSNNQKQLEAALQGLIREFVPSRDKFSRPEQHAAFDAARDALNTNDQSTEAEGGHWVDGERGHWRPVAKATNA